MRLHALAPTSANRIATGTNRCNGSDRPTHPGLRTPADRHALVAAAMTEGVYDWNIESGSLELSDRLNEMMGFEAGELNAADWNARVCKDDYETYRIALRRHFKGETPKLACEYRLRRKSGDDIWVADHGICVRNEAGRAVRLVGAVTDVTLQKTAEESLRKSRERYSLAMRAVNEGVYEWDLENDRVYYSNSVRRVLGLDPEQLKTPDDWFDRIHPEDRAQWRKALIRHLKRQTERFECEYRFRGANGGWRWARQQGIAQFDDNNRAIRIIGATGDVTDRKEAEIAIDAARDEADRARQQLVDAIEAISEGIVLFDNEDRIILCNSRYRSYFAESADEDVAAMVVPGAPFGDIVRAAHRAGMFPDISGDKLELYVDGRMRKRRAGIECRSVEQHLKDGRWLQINDRRTADGGIASVYTDITDRKRREDELAEKTTMLEGLSSKLSKYVSPQIYASIFAGEQCAEVTAERKKLTIIFSDIAGFTDIVDSLESEQLTSLLNAYLTEMSKIALEYGATIDKFIGDAILAFFGDPESRGVEADAIACVKMAVAMQQRMRQLRDEWQAQGIDDTFALRIGITTGFCTVGNFGSDDRIDYTVIGTPVNLAARLQAHAETGGILLANETRALVCDAVPTEEHDTITLKGIARPVRTHRVIGIYDDFAEAPQIINRNQEGLVLRVDHSQLNAPARASAIAALEDTIAALRRGACASQ